MPDEDLVRSVGELFNKIRNNVFHGVKVYDDAEDLELLQQVNPVLMDIIGRCEEELLKVPGANGKGLAPFVPGSLPPLAPRDGSYHSRSHPHRRNV
jgi:hypothetical protein